MTYIACTDDLRSGVASYPTVTRVAFAACAYMYLECCHVVPITHMQLVLDVLHMM